MRRISICLGASVLLACSEPSVESVSNAESLFNDTLGVSCRIGELIGDSLYVFGEITSAEPVPEGVAVLDIHSCKISFFSRDGQFIRSIGGHGEGPGEFLLPIDFAVLEDGRIAVADLMGRKIDILSMDGSLLTMLPTDYQILPYRMDAVSDSTFLVYYYTTKRHREQIEMAFHLGIWDTSGFRTEVWSYGKEHDGSDYNFAPGYINCCAGNGTVYYSEMMNSDFQIQAHQIDEGEDWTFYAEDGVSIPVDSADTGYDEPYAYVSFTSEETFIEMETEPLDYRPQIGEMGFDSDDRLWVRKGTTDAEEWLIYSEGGELLGSGTITGIDEPGRLRYVINGYGAIAWAPYTPDYPVLYVLSFN